MKKKSMLLFLVLIITFSLSASVFANNTENIRMGTLDSDSQYPFYDETDSISEETKNVILNINKNTEDTGAQVGVILLNSLNGSTIENKATELFNTWGLGDKEKNNGVLILISKNDRQFRVEVGEGLRNTVLSDREAANILDAMKPYCKDEAYNLAVQAGLFEVDKKFIEYRNLLQTRKDNSKEKEVVASSNEEEAIEDEGREETSNKISGIASNANKSKDNSNTSTAKKEIDLMNMVLVISFVGMFIALPVSLFIVRRQEKREEEEAERKRQEEIKARGKAVSVNVEVTNQYDMTETIKLEGYENEKVYDVDVKDEINRLLRHGELFKNIYDKNNKITGFTILENTVIPYNSKFKDIKDSTIKVKLKLIREEDKFMTDENKLKATQNFYETLEPEEKAFYSSRVKSNQETYRSDNFWFYMYLYILFNSERSNHFRSYMNNKDVKSDRFFMNDKDLRLQKEKQEEARRARESSSNSSNTFGSSFGSGSGFYNSGSSFGGFGGGSSSGGGASGGF